MIMKREVSETMKELKNCGENINNIEKNEILEENLNHFQKYLTYIDDKLTGCGTSNSILNLNRNNINSVEDFINNPKYSLFGDIGTIEINVENIQICIDTKDSNISNKWEETKTLILLNRLEREILKFHSDYTDIKEYCREVKYKERDIKIID